MGSIGVLFLDYHWVMSKKYEKESLPNIKFGSAATVSLLATADFQKLGGRLRHR